MLAFQSQKCLTQVHQEVLSTRWMQFGRPISCMSELTNLTLRSRLTEARYLDLNTFQSRWIACTLLTLIHCLHYSCQISFCFWFHQHFQNDGEIMIHFHLFEIPSFADYCEAQSCHFCRIVLCWSRTCKKFFLKFSHCADNQTLLIYSNTYFLG